MALVVVDAFTDQPFAGNPAAVAILPAFPDEARMQAVAGEMNLSETAFVVARGGGDYDLRWFTPSVEVDLCGHATLASAHVLGRPAVFHTRSGPLTCSPDGAGWIEMDFPADIPSACDPPVAGLRSRPGSPSLDLPPMRWYGLGRSDVLIELADAAAVRQLRPDLGQLAALGSRAVIFTAAGDREGIDCVSRVFAPGAGVPEDPVTGSAHCTLACYWGDRLGRHVLTGEQASPRGGLVRMRRREDRVVLGGQAVTVARVELLA